MLLGVGYDKQLSYPEVVCVLASVCVLAKLMCYPTTLHRRVSYLCDGVGELFRDKSKFPTSLYDKRGTGMLGCT